jgi:hypothetical protein
LSFAVIVIVIFCQITVARRARLHILSPGSTVCLDQMEGCKGNIHIDTEVSRKHPELFVPQGPASPWVVHSFSGPPVYFIGDDPYKINRVAWK